MRAAAGRLLLAALPRAALPLLIIIATGHQKVKSSVAAACAGWQGGATKEFRFWRGQHIMLSCIPVLQMQGHSPSIWVHLQAWHRVAPWQHAAALRKTGAAHRCRLARREAMTPMLRSWRLTCGGQGMHTAAWEAGFSTFKLPIADRQAGQRVPGAHGIAGHVAGRRTAQKRKSHASGMRTSRPAGLPAPTLAAVNPSTPMSSAIFSNRSWRAECSSNKSRSRCSCKAQAGR